MAHEPVHNIGQILGVAGNPKHIVASPTSTLTADGLAAFEADVRQECEAAAMITRLEAAYADLSQAQARVASIAKDAVLRLHDSARARTIAARAALGMAPPPVASTPPFAFPSPVDDVTMPTATEIIGGAAAHVMTGDDAAAAIDLLSRVAAPPAGTPSLADYFLDFCGYVMDVDTNKAAGGVQVVVSWQSMATHAYWGGDEDAPRTTAKAVTAADGSFRVSKIPRGSRVRIQIGTAVDVHEYLPNNGYATASYRVAVPVAPPTVNTVVTDVGATVEHMDGIEPMPDIDEPTPAEIERDAYLADVEREASPIDAYVTLANHQARTAEAEVKATKPTNPDDIPF